MTACGGGGGGSGSGDLQGQWLSQNVNSSGEHTRITFLDDGSFKIEAYKRTSSQLLSSLLDQGTYNADGNSLKFNFDNSDSVTSILTLVSENHIMIDDATYYRTNPDGSLAGGVVAGQIRIDDGSGEQDTQSEEPSALKTQSAVQGLSVDQTDTKAKTETAGTTQAIAPVIATVPSYIYIKNSAVVNMRMKDGTRKRVLISKPQALAAQVSGAKTLSDRFQALSVVRTDLKSRAEAAKAECKPETCKGAYIESKDGNYNIMRAQSVAVPNDPSYDRQWGMRSVNAPGGWAILDNVSTSEVKVAIVDTGEAFNPDLAAEIFESGYDFISDSDSAGDGGGRDSNPDDEGDDYYGEGQHSWHGTHIAGIIGAGRNNDEGVAGVNSGSESKVKILHLRALGANGEGTFSDIADAIKYAAGEINSSGTDTPGGARRAHVINLSLGCAVPGDTYSMPEDAPKCTMDALDAAGFTDAIQDALDKDVIVVAAAGNCPAYPSGCGAPFYPASYDGVIKVGGITSHGVFADNLSHYGHNQTVAGPSGSIEPSDDDSPYLGNETQIYNTGYNGYVTRAGTSQAAPFVAGAISAMLSINDNLTPAQVRTILEDKSLDLGATGYDDKYGNGLVDVGAALAEAYSLKGSGGIDTVAGIPDAELLVSQTDLNYGQIKNSKTLFLHKVGKGDLTGLTASKNESWIKSIDLSGTSAPASMKIEVDRDGLDPGSYDDTITVESSNGTEEVKVSISVPEPSTTSSGDSSGDGTTTTDGDGTSSGDSGGGSDFEQWVRDLEAAFGGAAYSNTQDIGEIIVLLVNAADNSVFAGLRTDFESNYRFEFGGLDDGDYYILAGQLNNAGLICDIDNTPDVPCTAYPSYSEPQLLKIQGANTIDEAFLGL